MYYTIKKGNHDSSPVDIPWMTLTSSLNTLLWTIKPSHGTEYNMLPDEDQWDVNKGGGVSFNLLNNNKDALMWGWRFNPNSNKTEILQYSHTDGNVVISEVMMELSKFQVGEIQFTRNGRVWDTFFTNYEHSSCGTYTARKGFTFSKEITLWFGGANNSPGPFGGVAPQDILWYISKTRS